MKVTITLGGGGKEKGEGVRWGEGRGGTFWSEATYFFQAGLGSLGAKDLWQCFSFFQIICRDV